MLGWMASSSINEILFYLISITLGDTIQVAKKMTKHSRDNSHCDQSSQQSSQGPTKYQTDLSRKRTGHRPEHQLFFLLVFLKDKNIFVNNLGSLYGVQIAK